MIIGSTRGGLAPYQYHLWCLEPLKVLVRPMISNNDKKEIRSAHTLCPILESILRMWNLYF